MEKTETFNNYRAYLFAIAYRMLGTAMDAEDMVQETYLRWQNSDVQAVESPKSFLAAIITRLCIDYLRSARVQRETYFGEWLPEPVWMGTAPANEENVLFAESISMAFLVLLESLSPTERAAFLLHDVFAYDYAEVAEMVDKSEANCRQLVSRARKRVQDGRPRFEATAAEQQQITAQFAQACLNGDMTGLLTLLAEDVVEYTDGGGKVTAAINPIHGADRVARYLLGLTKKLSVETTIQAGIVNNQPAIILYRDGQAFNVTVLDIADGRIQRIYNVINPDKLQHLSGLGS